MSSRPQIEYLLAFGHVTPDPVFVRKDILKPERGIPPPLPQVSFLLRGAYWLKLVSALSTFTQMAPCAVFVFAGSVFASLFHWDLPSLIWGDGTKAETLFVFVFVLRWGSCHRKLFLSVKIQKPPMGCLKPPGGCSAKLPCLVRCPVAQMEERCQILNLQCTFGLLFCCSRG